MGQAQVGGKITRPERLAEATRELGSPTQVIPQPMTHPSLVGAVRPQFPHRSAPPPRYEQPGDYAASHRFSGEWSNPCRVTDNPADPRMALACIASPRGPSLPEFVQVR